jgi:hypothetical protein
LECFIEPQGLLEIFIPVHWVYMRLLMPITFVLMERANMIALNAELFQRVFTYLLNQRDKHIVELKGAWQSFLSE